MGATVSATLSIGKDDVGPLVEGAGFEPVAPVGAVASSPVGAVASSPVGAVASSPVEAATLPEPVEIRRLRTLADVVALDMVLLVCGLNPSLYAADAGVNFARPGNRFWPAACAAGLVSVDRDPWHALHQHGVGFTDMVKRATVSAAELSPAEYRHGLRRLAWTVRLLRPRTVCFVGLAGYRAAVDRRAVAGALPEGFAGAAAYLMPNPSGLNAHARPADIARHLAAAAALA